MIEVLLHTLAAKKTHFMLVKGSFETKRLSQKIKKYTLVQVRHFAFFYYENWDFLVSKKKSFFLFNIKLEWWKKKSNIYYLNQWLIYRITSFYEIEPSKARYSSVLIFVTLDVMKRRYFFVYNFSEKLGRFRKDPLSR